MLFSHLLSVKLLWDDPFKSRQNYVTPLLKTLQRLPPRVELKVLTVAYSVLHDLAFCSL